LLLPTPSASGATTRPRSRCTRSRSARVAATRRGRSCSSSSRSCWRGSCSRRSGGSGSPPRRRRELGQVPTRPLAPGVARAWHAFKMWGWTRIATFRLPPSARGRLARCRVSDGDGDRSTAAQRTPAIRSV
jgi:hypothetical protein